MRRLTGPIAVTALLALAPSLAHAAACTTKGVATAHALPLPPASDTAFYRALVAATQPKVLPLEAKATRCTRTGGLIGENTDPLPRVLPVGSAPTAGASGYLAPVPLLKDGKPTTAYVLVKVWGSGAVRAELVLDAIPADAKLYQAMKDFTDGGFDPLGFNEKTGQVIDAQDYLKGVVAQETALYDAPARR